MKEPKNTLTKILVVVGFALLLLFVFVGSVFFTGADPADMGRSIWRSHNFQWMLLGFFLSGWACIITGLLCEKVGKQAAKRTSKKHSHT